MSLTMPQIDSFIDSAINNLGSESGRIISEFYVDLRSMQTRITQKLVDESIGLCGRRGITAERSGDGLIVRVDLRTCRLNPQQSVSYNTALAYTRSVHGNHL